MLVLITDNKWQDCAQAQFEGIYGAVCADSGLSVRRFPCTSRRERTSCLVGMLQAPWATKQGAVLLDWTVSPSEAVLDTEPAETFTSTAAAGGMRPPAIS